MSEGLSAGWQLALIVGALLALGLAWFVVSDMHHYGYGIFAR